MCPQPLELRGPYDITNLYPSAVSCVCPVCVLCVYCVCVVLLTFSSEVCCSVCQMEMQKKPSPPPVDLWYYTQVHNPYNCNTVQQYYCSITVVLQQYYCNTCVCVRDEEDGLGDHLHHEELQ